MCVPGTAPASAGGMEEQAVAAVPPEHDRVMLCAAEVGAGGGQTAVPTTSISKSFAGAAQAHVP